MKKINLPLLKKIVETAGAPGYEYPIRNVLIDEIKNFVDEFYVDNIGNLVAFKKGKTQKRMVVDAHIDEISFIASHIDKEGFIRFQPLGGFDPKTLTSQRVMVHGKKDIVGVIGAKPIHVMTPEERNTAPKLKDYFVDVGMPEKELRKIVTEGDVITRKSSVETIGNNINAKSLDNRICVYILVELIKSLKHPNMDFYGVFSVQEEVGLRGSLASTLEIQPDFGICLDTTIAFDTPGSTPQEHVTKLGNGCSIKIMDASAISDYRMVEMIKKVAEKNKIKWQPEIMHAGGTNTARIQQNRSGGTIVGGISIPTRYIHQTIEMVNKDDVLGGINLTSQVLSEINKHDWKHK